MGIIILKNIGMQMYGAKGKLKLYTVTMNIFVLEYLSLSFQEKSSSMDTLLYIQKATYGLQLII